MDSLVLKGDLTERLTDEEFYRFCEDNPDVRMERNSDLQIVIMSPVSTLSGFYSTEVIRQLSNWSVSDGRGLAFDASTGFTLPDRSILSPDASWLLREKWDRLSLEQKERFAPICPDFVIEVRSKSDSLETLMNKMRVWIQNGASEGWLLDPRDKRYYLFLSGRNMKTVEGTDVKLSAEGMANGFDLDVSRLKA